MEGSENSASSLKASHGKRTSSDPHTSIHVPSTSTAGGIIHSFGDIQSSNTSKFIDVCFHAVISPTMLKNPDTDQVAVALISRGGVYSFHNLALEKKRLLCGYYVASKTVQLPETLFGVAESLSYTYCVIHEDLQSKTWEHFSPGYMNEKNSNRKLSIQAKYLNTGTYHRYDGVVRESRRLGEGTMLYSLKKWFGINDFHKLLLNDAEVTMEAFQPVWQLTSMEADGINGEELITHMSLIIEGMTTAGLWFESKAGIHKPFALLPYMKQQIQYLGRTNRDQLDEEAKILHLITAVTVIHLVDEYEVELEHNDKRLLCEALLPMPDFEKKISPDVEHLKKYLPTIYKKVAKSVLKFSRGIAGKTSDPIWLFSVPIIHFMLDKCKPFENAPPTVDHDATVPKWWGVVEYENDIDCFKDKLKWNRSADEVVKRLAPYFKVDYLLPRTLLASLRLDLMHSIVRVNDISPDIILAASCYYLKKKPNNVVVSKMLQHVSQNGFNTDVSISSMFSAWRSCRIAGDLLGECLKQQDANKEVRLLAVEVFLLPLHSFYEIQKMLYQMQDEGDEQLKNQHVGIFKDFLARIVFWLLNETCNMLEYMKLWNAALSIKLPEGYIQRTYINRLQDSLLESLQEKAVYDKLVQIYCVHTECFEGIVQDILSQVALKAVNNCTNIDWSKGDKVSMHLGALLSGALEKSWDIEEFNDPHEFLSHALNWRSFPIYMEMLRNNPKALSDDCKDFLERFAKEIQPFIENILHGSISIKYLVEISKNRESFQKMIVAMKCKDTGRIMKTLAIREKEFEAFKRNYQMVKEFINVCKQCKADTSVLEKQLITYYSTDMMYLNQLVTTVSLKDLKKAIEMYQPTVIVFKLCPKEFEILPIILTCSKSFFFLKIWKQIGTDLEKQNGKQIDVKEVFDKVWKPAFELWTNLTKKLREGNMLFSEFKKWFEANLSEMELRQEFSLLASDGKTEWINKRIFEITQYGNLKNCVSGADIIMKVVKAFEFEGDFSQIQDIIKLAECADTCMKKLDASLLKTSAILGEISEERVKCLKDFIECKSLVDWLKESMPDGLKELKVFIELASNASGEGDMEIDKVNCLHSATTGYAPLIFNLEKKCNTKIFLEKCLEIWKELASNPQLPRMLVDTSSKLEWLKSVKKAHGSVEVSSMAQAEAINENGVYHVGNVRKATLLKNLVLADVLELERKFSQKNQFYKYEQLHDLQSRLMLVTGKAEKGKDDVDRFMLILDSVVRLGNIYTKLVTDGCVLFLQWHVDFLCNKTEQACTVIHFGHGENGHTLKGRTDEMNEDVSDIIPKLAKFLEQCHDKWLDFIDDNREKYYSLNFFTIDQMVILQQELVKIGSGQEPSAVIYPLLSAVKQGCTKEDLVSAMSAAKSDVERLNMDRQKEMEKKDSEEEDMMIVEKEPDDLKNGELNDVECTENQKSLASIIERDLVEQQEYGTGEMDIESLIKALGKRWTDFLASISLSMSDYLGMEHLGMVLNRLTKRDTFKLERTFLSCFNEGEPNLIVCPQSEIYNTVLAVYSHEDDKPLPQSDEVLLCTPHTTLDMLEIFWRRALFADNDKVHCLVNADLLDYDVSDKGEKSLERHMKSAENKERSYRLVVICSSENEYKSRIVAALDKYHTFQLNYTVANIRKYLLTKFQINKTFPKGIKPASAIDFEKCSVRVVKSWRAGVGKTLFKKRMANKLEKVCRTKPAYVTIPLHEKTINVDNIMDIFLEQILPPQSNKPRLFHIDISHEVQEGVDALLFQLLILGCLGHSSGHVWRRSELDYYIIESMPLLARDANTQGGELKCLHYSLDILPHVMCRSPQESLEILCDIRKPPDYTVHDRLFDLKEFKSKTFQRPFQYLNRLDTDSSLIGINPAKPEGDAAKCLRVLLKHCGIRNPSWSELHHFVSFLNKQLQDFEESIFCGTAAVEDLPGFAKFVLRFLIQMSRDFSTRSLVVSEESPIQMLERQVTRIKEEETEDDTELQLYQMRRTWETSPHPYLFFNADRNTMTFLGFNIVRNTGDLIDVKTKAILEEGMMQTSLFDVLVGNLVNLAENFDLLLRDKKIQKLCNVMGQDMAHDPDETYELTTDNVKKILAIYMRFRCQIPVIIMGETGCGKTRLIKFMCALQQPPGANVENMIIMKVHGGTKTSDIVRKVRKTEEIADENAKRYNMDTVLFFDEANTTEAIGVIKEIMCDKSVGGKPIKLHERLKIVAACNPYRKHSEELIKRLEQAGLGYHVHADKTSDKLGRVPMRHLVYRVQPLPKSMLPLVWDFGQLNTEVEEMYIRQMVLRYIKNQHFPASGGIETILSKILMISQDFMREQQDECSFVSLRDVERVLQVMSWFYRQSKEGHLLFRRMRDESSTNVTVDDLTRSLVLALGVCYHACLKNREEYREAVAGYFIPPLQLAGGADQIDEEISKCQSVFLDSVDLAPNIAKNQALKENVFMMIVCIELRIPLFLVGKPGSSKSLAKTIVANAMQGNAAQNKLFKNYKQVQMVSFQCSPLSAPEGIVGTFRQCAAYQKDKNLDRFVSIVVLDEIGLAEDSPKMPLKALHPLLEDGCPDDEEPEIYKKVAFIGISNWALDPAKMNRGILVQREVPNVTELRESAEGICSTNYRVLRDIRPMIEPLAVSYLEVFEEASTEMREFFGLRDFYSLMKMLYAFMASSNKKLTWLQLKHSILRNFGGLENVTPVDIFARHVSHLVDQNEKKVDDPDCTPAGMIQACLTGDNNAESESRYLLLLTENYGALTILQQKIFTMDNAVVIFGSSFPSDQEYTQICRNINRIKVCMETGSTVILLNLENLYESLYDALNQYYVCFGGERYVDLGLGSHRVKCRVHLKFRLIVVAETQIVYKNFPIPLINRLEKHFLSLKTMLAPAQLRLADKLQKWAQCFCEVKVPAHMRQKKNRKKIGDAFMGYHDDACPAIILHICQQRNCNDQNILQLEQEILKDAQFIMLWCAAPAAVVQGDTQEAFITYFKVQQHESLADYLHNKMVDHQQHYIQAQITTNSKLLSTADIDILCRCIPIQRQNVTLLTLQSFDTEQQFCRQIKSFLDQGKKSNMLLIVQCDCGDQNADLIACARHTVQGELQQVRQNKTADIHVVFLIQLPGIAGGCFTGFQCGLWHSVHIDDIHPAPDDMPSVADMHGKSVSALLALTAERPEVNMEKQDDPKDEKRMETTKKQFKIESLIKKCVQPALGNVKDPDSDSSRAIDRLKIILNCFNNVEDELTFVSGIAKHLTNILKEKEQTGVQSVIKNWLSTETSKPENTNRPGTFRKFAVQRLESKVIPILSGIFAFIDTNRNLDILTSGDNQDWKIGIWLQIFNNPDLTQLKYSLMVSPSQQEELQEVAVKTTSVDGNVFSALMPFSWLIFGQIDEVLRKTIESKDKQDTHSDVVIKASEIFSAIPMGRLLADIEETHTKDILKCYINDFIHMVHPVQSEVECKIVSKNVWVGCKQLIRGEFGRLIPSLVGCHMTYILHDARFKNFSHIICVWPECGKKMVDKGKVSDDEMTLASLDILALFLLVDHLEPNEEVLNKKESRTKWLRQVCDYRPVIERILGHFSQDIENEEFCYGKRCQEDVEHTRLQWTRVVVVKLFIEHVCTTGKENLEIRRCMPLWKSFPKGANMKDVTSLDKVEKFLKDCNKEITTDCFGRDCVSCKNFIEEAPVVLPCRHVVCRNCFDTEQKLLQCPNCQMMFHKDWDPYKSVKSEEFRKHYDYRRRYNSFFMEVVSQLCFSEGTAPSKEVVEKLLSYITGHSKTHKLERVVSKKLTIFDDAIDPSPVVRSFLLQKLMQTSEYEIDTHLSAYFTHASDLVKTNGDPQQLVELCMLVLQCLEDSLHQQYANTDDEITMATRMLREATPCVETSDINILEDIKYISRVRFSLTVVAKYIHKFYGTPQASSPDHTTQSLFAAASKLCDEFESQWPREFFVKQLCRCYGIDCYQKVLSKSDERSLRWVRLPQLKPDKVEECHDRYIVIGDEYTELRETVVTTALNENSKNLEQILQKSANEWQTRIKLLLALHREITMNNVYGGDPKKFTDKAKAFLSEFVMNCGLIRNKDLIDCILNNTLWRPHRNIVPRMDLAQQNISCLLTHFFVLMVEIPGKTTLLTPLQNIALQPQSMVNSFFPTMPQDELSEIKEAILAASKGNETPVFYRCPNGHPYVIGNCGGAVAVGVCKDCGENIGGEKYKLRPGNELDAGNDTTETGHILGRASKLGPITVPERKLNRATFSILRLLTHISMYIGAKTNLVAVCQSIKPNIEQGDVHKYLLEHIDLNLTSIQNVLGKNKDDVLILIHFLFAQIMKVIDENRDRYVYLLLRKDSRARWEDEFAQRYIVPVVQDMENILTKCNDQVLKDERLGSDPLLQILYETDKPQKTNNDWTKLKEIPAAWRYRALITVNHLKQQISTTQQELSVLRLFLQEEHHLRAIRFIPSIVRLQKMLIQKYSRKLDRAEATTLTIQDVKTDMRQEWRSEIFEHLLEDYKEAWNCVRETLEIYVCPANENLVTIAKGCCKLEITDETKISHLLPTHRDAGLCSYVLLFFLMKKQNLFLQNYCVQCGIKEDSLPTVHMKNISSAHLISYHPDRDLLPMVLANCNYSFEVGKGTKVEYNFTNLERQLLDRFLFSKSIIHCITEIETITYRSESTNFFSVVFKSLCDRIKQVRLSPAVQSQICGELCLKSYPDMCESLDKLDIAISYLKSVGSDPESSLYHFMTDTLKMENPFPSQKAQQVSRCKHTMSMWITMTLERAKYLAKHDKIAFEGISDNFKEPLTEEQRQAIEEILNKLPVEQIDILVELIFECIVLKIDVPQNKDDEDYVDMSKISLRDALIGYLDACPYEEELTIDESLMTAVGQLPSDTKDPLRVLTAHSVEIWNLVYQVFTNKQRQRH